MPDSNMEARRRDRCFWCQLKPILAKRKDSGGWRALYWCTNCRRIAFGGCSFVRVPPEVFDRLPLIEEVPAQGKLW